MNAHITPKPIGHVTLGNDSFTLDLVLDRPYRGITAVHLLMYYAQKDELRKDLSIEFEAKFSDSKKPIGYNSVDQNRGLNALVNDWRRNPAVFRLAIEGFIDEAYLRNPSKTP